MSDARPRTRRAAKVQGNTGTMAVPSTDDSQKSTRIVTRRGALDNGTGSRTGGRGRSRRRHRKELPRTGAGEKTSGPTVGATPLPRASSDHEKRGRRRRRTTIVEDTDSADDAPRAEDCPQQEPQKEKRRKKADLQLEVTEILLHRVDDYIAKEIQLPNVVKRLSRVARVVGHSGDQEMLKRKVSEYVRQYILALLKFRKAHADPYGDGVDKSCSVPMLNIPQGPRSEPLPAKQLFDSVSSYGLRVKLPDGLKAKRGATRNDILLSFSCFSTHRKAQNYMPFLRPNRFLEELPGFASPTREKRLSPELPEHGNCAFLWKALVADIDRYKIDESQFKTLQLTRIPTQNTFLVLRAFWEEYATLSLMRRIQDHVVEGRRDLSLLVKENRPETWLEATDSTFFDDVRFSLITFVAKEPSQSFYTSGRNELLRYHICALFLFCKEEFSDDDSRLLAYVWKVGRKNGVTTWTLWVPGRYLTRNREIRAQAVPLFECISESRRATAVSRLLYLHRSLAQIFFCPRRAPEIKYRGYRHLVGDGAARAIYSHYETRLNESQFEVLDKVMKALSTDQEKEGNNVIAVQGPPGTGKSTVIVSTVALLLAKMESEEHRGKKIIVCAPSNAAVDVLARRLKEGIDIAVVEETPYSINVRKQAPKLVRIGPECTDPSLSSIRVEKLVSKKIEEEGVHDLEFPNDARNRVRKEVLNERNVWCSTLMNIMNDKYEDEDITKDVLAVIVDEAGQALEIDCLMPLLAFPLSKPPLYILVGDTKQLPPYEDIPEGRKIVEQNLLGRITGYMQHTSNNCVRLKLQYRMHHAIAKFPATVFYRDNLQNASSIYDARIFERPYHFDQKGRFGPVTFIDTKKIARNVEYYPQGDSACNHCEAEVIKGLVTSLVRLHSAALEDGVVLLSPYSRQLEVLSWMCERIPEMSQIAISTSTVDSMQGGETGIVIMSTVRSNWRKELGFLLDYRRVNVGMTRARFSLIVVGNSETLESDEVDEDGSTGDYGGIWKRFISFCKDDSTTFTHYVSPTGSNVNDETVARELFPESLSSSGIEWDHQRFVLQKKRE